MNQRVKNRVCLFTRVSTDKQCNDRQVLELKEYCERQGYSVVKTISTTITGSKTQKDRPDLIELFASAKRKEFDKVLVTEISRIGRNAKDVRNTVDELHSIKIGIIFKNLGIESLDEQDKETFVTNIIISIYSELASEERNILVQRIKSGIASAKSKGKKLGRPEGSENIDTLLKRYHRLVKDLRSGVSIRQGMRLHNVSKGTVLKIKRCIK
jgi:DNA invertase Pin-like site-specific DNA recombinase